MPKTTPKSPARGFTDQFLDNLSPAAERYELADKGCSGLRLRVSKSGIKTFVWIYSDGSKTRRLTLGRYGKNEGQLSLKQARDELYKAKERHWAGMSPSAPDDDSPRTVKQLCEVFYTDRIHNHRKRPEVVRDILDREIVPDIGNRKLSALSAPIAGIPVKNAVKRGAKVHAVKVAAIIKQMFRFAEGRGFVDRSPAYALDAKNYGAITDSVGDRHLSSGEIRIVWQALEKAPRLSLQAKNGIKILLLTGVRTSELVLAKWSEIDFDNKIWDIPEANSKTTAWKVPLSPQVIHLLNELKEWDDTWVLAGRRLKNSDEPSPHLTDKALGRAVKRLHSLKDKDGVLLMDIPRWTPHDLRRTMRTHMDDLRIQPHIAEKCLNHSLGAIEKTYNKNDLLKQRREALEKWANHVDVMVRDDKTVSVLRRA
ncbi:MAG: tyrosine-type recombinase/integrase [Candidatus Thiodiazotropha endolucinida]